MTSFFPDVNVWIALSVIHHSHNSAAWQWLGHLPRETSLIFSRYTQVGLLRLLTNQAAMGEETLKSNVRGVSTRGGSTIREWSYIRSRATSIPRCRTSARVRA